MAMIAGTIAKDGSPQSGGAFTSERVGEPGAHSYRVAFDGAGFAAPPAVVVTPLGAEAVFASVEPAGDGTGFTVTFQRLSFAARGEVTTVTVASAFSFAAFPV